MSEKKNKIVVEVLIDAPIELVWERTQEPVQHVSWDIRFTSITYQDALDARGYHTMEYRTRIGFGLEILGFGHYLHSTPLALSTFEFDSHDPKSLITKGRGIWAYEPRGASTYFKTVYDYEVRFGVFGRILDVLLFRRVLQLATEWGFETLRRWCAGEDTRKQRLSRLRFLAWFLKRTFTSPPAGAARSWLGTGQAKESLLARG